MASSGERMIMKSTESFDESELKDDEKKERGFIIAKGEIEEEK